ncbi:hypothetical protein C8P66_12553 [Humitalea rosea]|uniref:Uncharacterized protein n=1 Tax=Humitalea rosea TaxID=990373 RepID=A0A2W7I038_9PROT|nr:hypothetical protein [Humitalea rosea]PZW40084.1 hypothetical protein C8P66_12553 [Humitalea rosea]
MSLTLADVRNQERDAILGEYLVADVPPYTAIPDISVLMATPSVLRAKHPLGIEAFPRASTAQGFVQICPSLGYKFLRLPPDDDNYLATYKSFLKKHHGLGDVPSGYDVDHLFNRARAIDLGLGFVRMVLLGPGENRSHGAGYEASRTKGGIGRPGRERGIDEIMLMKLCGIRSPRKNRPLSLEMLTHVHYIAALFGLPPLAIELNIRDLMSVAAFRPDEP